MKRVQYIIIIQLLLSLVVLNCQQYPFTVSSDCSSRHCITKTWNFQDRNHQLKCPLAGESATFRNVSGRYVLELVAYHMTSQNVNVSIPLNYHINYTREGIQYSSQLDNGVIFAILNCTLPFSKHLSKLCRSYDLVGGNFHNSTFTKSCAFGLNKSKNNTLYDQPFTLEL